MASVESRIVTMKFDNKQFLSGVGAVISALGKLKGSLGFDSSKNGLKDVQADADKFSLKNVEGATQGVSKAFLAMSTIAITALANLTNKAVDAGLRIAKSLTLDGVIQGFQEYELNIKSIQTILANTKSEGTNLQQVNAALDELNTYADKTIYNFAEMTKNIGTFTAAGVDLDTSVSSIKGIANLAAISGSSSQQASTAMYQLSQAISSGSVKLMDWNSVVNAGMGGRVFQEALYETGKAMGTITDVPLDKSFKEWTASGGNFRESLQEGWITADVLTTTLGGISGELSDADLAAQGFSKSQIAAIQDLGKLGVESATKVRTITQLFDTAQEAVASGWSYSFRLIIGDFEEATELFTKVSGVFDKIIGDSADARNKMLADWKELGGRDAILQGLENAFIGLGKIFGTVRDAFRDVFPPITGERLAELSQRFSEFTAKLIPSSDTLEKIGNIARGVFSVFALGVKAIKAVAGFFADLFGVIFGNSGGFLTLASNVGEFFSNLNAGIPSFEIFGGAAEKADGFIKGLGEALGRMGDYIQPALDALKQFGSNIGEVLSNSVGSINWNTIFAGVGAGAAGGIFLTIRNFLKDGISLDIGGGFLEEIGDSISQFSKVLQGVQQNLKANALLKIAGAIAILAASLLVLSLIDPKRLASAVAGVAASMTILLGAMGTISSISTSAGFAKMGTVIAGLLGLSAALLIFTFAVKNLSSLSWEDLAKGLIGVAAGVGILSAAIKPLAKGSKGMFTAGLGLIALSVALLIMSKAVEKMSDLEWEEIGRGMVGIAASLGTLIAALKLMPKNIAVKAAGLVIMAGALILISKAVESFAAQDIGEAGKGLLIMAGALVIMALALKLMPKNMAATAAGLLIVSVALGFIVDAIKDFAGMEISELAQGLIALALALAILGVALSLMSGTVAGSLALLIAAAAINLIVPALTGLAQLSWGDIVKGLVAFAGAILVVGLAAAVFGLAAPLLLLGGAALLVFGAGLALVGVAALAFATAFEIAVRAAGAGADVLRTAFDAAIEAIPRAIEAFGEGVVLFVKKIGEAQTEFVTAFSNILSALLDAGLENVPKMGELFRKLLDEGIKTIREKFPELVDLGWEMVRKIVNGISNNMPWLVEKGAEIIVKFLRGIKNNIQPIVEEGGQIIVRVIRGIGNNINNIIDEGARVVIKFIRGISDNSQDVVDEGFDAVIDFINGVAASIRANSGDLQAAGGNLAGAIVSGLTGGLSDAVGRVAAEARNLASQAVNAAKDFFGIKSPSKVFMEIGRYVDEGLAVGLSKHTHIVEKEAEAVAQTTLSTMKASLRNLNDVVSSDISTQPVITPILDLSKVQKDAASVGKMFDSTTLTATTSVARASSISADRAAQLQEAAATSEAVPSSVQFNQYNTSPKALSSIDIYRNTRNQLSLAKEALTP